MTLSKKVLALSCGALAALSVAAFGQGPKTTRSAAKPAQSGDSLIVGGTIDWYEKSDVSALREGVIEKIEYQEGSRVEAGKPIGFLHQKMAELTAKKAVLAAGNTGPIESAKAKSQLAKSEVARLRRLERMGKGFVSESEIQKAEAEVQVAEAQKQEALENKTVAEAEAEIAHEVVREHTILAPFTGIITDKIKNQGEAVRANEAVVRVGRTDKLRFLGYLPLASAPRVQVGDSVEVRATIDGVALPVEERVFHGKVISISREIITSVNKNDAQIVAEIIDPEDANNPDLSLRPGLKGEMRVILRTADAPAAVGLKTGR